jgi:hypothetical protein
MENSSLKEHLCSLEERLSQLEVRKSVKELEALLADDFIEFGSSGCIFNKRQVIDGLVNKSPVQMTLMDFNAKLLASDVALTTYRIVKHKERKYSLRSSIWKWKEGKWQMVFHQGTPSVEP